MDVFNPNADAFRFYFNGLEAFATPKAAENVNIFEGISSDVQLQLRYRVQEDGAGSIAGATTDDYTIEYQVNGIGGFTLVTASSARVQTDTGSALIDDDPTTDRLSAGSGSFFAGIQEEGDGEVTDFQHEADNYTNHVWALKLIAADWSDGDFVEFRMRLNGGAMDNDVTPRITAEEFVPDADKFRLYFDGTESGSSPRAAEDVNITGVNVDSDVQVHVRIRVVETGQGDGASTDDYHLMRSLNGAGFSVIDGSSLFVRSDPGSGLVDGAVSTNRTTNGITNPGSGLFNNGEQEEVNGVIEDRLLLGGDYTEHVWAVLLRSADLANGDFVEFRVTLNGTANADDISSINPRIDVVKTVSAAIRDPIHAQGVIPFAR